MRRNDERGLTITKTRRHCDAKFWRKKLSHYTKPCCQNFQKQSLSPKERQSHVEIAFDFSASPSLEQKIVVVTMLKNAAQ